MENLNQEKSEHAINAKLTGENIRNFNDWEAIEPQRHYSNNHNLVDKLGYTKYTLNSDNSRSIKVPAKYAEKAKQLIHLVLESRNADELLLRVKEYPSLAGIYITDKTLGLMGKDKKIGSHETRKLMDETYILTCLNMCYDELAVNEGVERLNTIRNTEYLKKTLESL